MKAAADVAGGKLGGKLGNNRADKTGGELKATLSREQRILDNRSTKKMLGQDLVGTERLGVMFKA